MFIKGNLASFIICHLVFGNRIFFLILTLRNLSSAPLRTHGSYFWLWMSFVDKLKLLSVQWGEKIEHDGMKKTCSSSTGWTKASSTLWSLSESWEGCFSSVPSMRKKGNKWIRRRNCRRLARGHFPHWTF